MDSAIVCILEPSILFTEIVGNLADILAQCRDLTVVNSAVLLEDFTYDRVSIDNVNSGYTLYNIY